MPRETETGAGRGVTPPIGGQLPPVPGLPIPIRPVLITPDVPPPPPVPRREAAPIAPVTLLPPAPIETIQFPPSPAPAPAVNRPPVPTAPPTIERVVAGGGALPTPQPLGDTAGNAARCVGRRCPLAGRVIGEAPTTAPTAPEGAAGQPGAAGATGAAGAPAAVAPASALALVLVAILALVALKG